MQVICSTPFFTVTLFTTHSSSQSHESSLPMSPSRLGSDQGGTPGSSESSSFSEATRNLPISPSSLVVKEEPCDMATVFIKWEMSEEGLGEAQESTVTSHPDKESPGEKGNDFLHASCSDLYGTFSTPNNVY